MARKKPDTTVFSPVRFGERVRELRRACSYKSTKEFSDAIQQCTGVYIDHDSLIKIERGEREPDISKFIAICEAIARRQGGSRQSVEDDLLTYSEPVWFFIKNDAGDALATLLYAEFATSFAEQFSREPTADELLEAFAPTPVCELAISEAAEGLELKPTERKAIVDTLIRTLIYRQGFKAH